LYGSIIGKNLLLIYNLRAVLALLLERVLEPDVLVLVCWVLDTWLWIADHLRDTVVMGLL